MEFDETLHPLHAKPISRMCFYMRRIKQSMPAITFHLFCARGAVDELMVMLYD